MMCPSVPAKAFLIQILASTCAVSSNTQSPTFMTPEPVQIRDTGIPSQEEKGLAEMHGKGELRVRGHRNREEQCEGNANTNKS